MMSAALGSGSNFVGANLRLKSLLGGFHRWCIS